MLRTRRTTARSRRLPALAAAAALGLAVLTGCGSVAEKVAENAIKNSDSSIKDVDVDKDGGFSVDGEDGSIAFGSKAELPDGFPDDVPLPAGDATLSTAITQEEETAVMYTVKDPDLDAERERLAAELEASGYDVGDQSTMDVEGMASFALTGTGHGRQVSITYMKTDGEDAQVMYSIRPEA